MKEGFCLRGITCVPVLALTLLSEAFVAAQSIDDAAIEKAIKAGQDKKLAQLVSDCVATAGFGEGLGAALAGGIQPDGAFSVVVSANLGRIAFMASEAKRLYKPLSIADIPEELRTPAVFVFVDPHKPSRSQNTYSVASPVERVVLKAKTKPDAVVQPEKFETEPVEWSNLLGGKVEANRALALFPMEAARNLPQGDVDVVVITQAGERRCKVGTKDRDRLFPPNR
jgi:hypothetical protein